MTKQKKQAWRNLISYQFSVYSVIIMLWQQFGLDQEHCAQEVIFPFIIQLHVSFCSCTMLEFLVYPDGGRVKCFVGVSSAKYEGLNLNIIFFFCFCNVRNVCIISTCILTKMVIPLKECLKKYRVHVNSTSSLCCHWLIGCHRFKFS